MADPSTLEIGSEYGPWLIVAVTTMPTRPEKAFRCRCKTCGTEKLIRGFEINKGTRTRCFTCYVNNGQERNGFGRLYRVWCGIKERCESRAHHAWNDYGGRGIYLCAEWHSFHTFKHWALTNGYKLGLHIDRIDNDGPYAPWNCRWASREVNANNKRSNVVVEAFGETKTLRQWSRDERCVVAYKTLHERIRKYGVEPEVAITRSSRIKKARAKWQLK